MELVRAQLASAGQRRGSSPVDCPDALSAWGVKPGAGGTVAFMLLAGKGGGGSCAERCRASRFPAKPVLPGKPAVWGRGLTPEKARPRGTEVLQQILQVRKRRWWPLRQGALALPLLQARLLCPPETRLGFEGASSPPISPQGEALSRWGRTLLRKPSTSPKSFSLGMLPPSGQIHAAQGCLAHPIKVLSLSIPQRFPCCAPPWDQVSPTPGYRAQLGLHWEGLAWDCRTGLWCYCSSHSSPEAAPKDTVSCTKSP